MPATPPTKPTVRNPDWGSDPGQTLDPGAARETNGWDADDRPPARWWNWILNAFSQWSQWAEAAIDELFTEKVDKTGTDTIEWVTFTDPDEPRLKDEQIGASLWRNWLENRGASLNKVRIYAADNYFGFTMNRRYEDGSSSWVEEATASGFIGLAGRDDFGNVIPANTMVPNTVPKAMGKIEISGGSGSLGSESVGLNPTVGLSPSAVTINLVNAMASTDYFVQITNANSLVPMHFTASPSTTSTIVVAVFDASGTILNPTANAIQFFIEVKGRQPRPV